MQSLEGRVVVITGASSGLGREAAIQFAAEGCRVVIAARRLEALESCARACREAGGEALVQVTDVTDEDAVAALAAAALRQWGRIDVWVNNAGVTMFGDLESGELAKHRRVIETNLFGAIYAVRSVMPVFRRQRAGVMINVGSVLSEVGQPFVPSYVISKFALRGMSETLRTALADEPDIHVCTILPYAMDTPHFESGANEFGAPAYPMPPKQSPEKVASVLVKLAANPRREQLVPRIAALGLAFRWLMPVSCEKLIAHTLGHWHFGETHEPRSEGNLFRALPEDGAVHGERPPRIGVVPLAAFVAADFVRIQVNGVLDWMSSLLRPGASPSSTSQSTAQRR